VGNPPRGWQLWRRAFWTRPALLVLYAIAAGALGVALLASVPDEISDALAIRHAPECPAGPVRTEAKADPPTGCLERVPVVLSGPRHRREWDLLLERDGRLTFYADTNISAGDSAALSDNVRVDALLWKGEPVLIVVPGEGRVETESWGHRRWLISLGLGMFAASGLPMLIEAARLKRRTTNGWWSVRGEPVRIMVLSPLVEIAFLLAMPPMLAAIPLWFALSLPWVVGGALLGLGLTIFSILKAARSHRRGSARTARASPASH
jgi:hypothetical protein